jgi:hypothetical protein
VSGETGGTVTPPGTDGLYFMAIFISAILGLRVAAVTGVLQMGHLSRASTRKCERQQL